VATTEQRRDRINSQRRYESEAQNVVNQEEDTMTTHRVHEHELLQRLERLCEAAGLEFPKEAWPKDDHKAYFLLGVCATEDMKGLSLCERLALRKEAGEGSTINISAKKPTCPTSEFAGADAQ
jgi:hypothetical protein